MIQKYVMTALKEGKNKRTRVVATDVNESSDEDEAFGVDHINLADSKLHYGQSTWRRETTIKHLHLII